MSEPLLTVKQLKVSYGGIHAVKGIDFTVNSGEQVTLIGANGAGKTSSLRALTGLQPFEGEILFDGRSIRGMPPHRLLQQGLVMVPEGRGIFARMTVRENLQLGAYSRRDKPAVRQDLEQVCTLFRVCVNGCNSRPGCSPAVNSRWWPSVGRYSAVRACWCWMSLRWGWHRSWLKPFLRSSKTFLVTVSRYYWWNKMPDWHWHPLTVPMYWTAAV